METADFADIFKRRKTHFVLWGLKSPTTYTPQLVIGEFLAGNPPTLTNQKKQPLKLVSGFSDLWEVSAAECNLTEEKVYHYWFEVQDTDPEKSPSSPIYINDPIAHTIDWRLIAPRLSSPYNDDDRRSASVIKYQGGILIPCDPGGETPDFAGEPNSSVLPPNNRMVLYELPTAWSKGSLSSGLESGVGTFVDVLALIDRDADGQNFSDLSVVRSGLSYLTDLGINALELLPPADSFYRREWGYGTTNFLAPDHELGFPEGNSSPTANSDLTALIVACHKNKIRFFVDMVMAFCKQGSFQCLNFDDFHINKPENNQNDPDALTSTRSYGRKEVRNGFGSSLFRYAKQVNDAYDPISGTKKALFPARQYMMTYLVRWMLDFHIDGIRLDSIENVFNWDFMRDFKDFARILWNQRWNSQGLSTLNSEANSRFLVVGEELTVPKEIVRQRVLDGLWNEDFKKYIRAAIIGQNAANEPSFEWTVRKAIDSREMGFTDASQAIIYLTSHDVEGFRNERPYNFLGTIYEKKQRIQLAFVCLLTAVGIPMILAGDEFADEHDRFDRDGNVSQSGGKQVDPVNFSRLEGSNNQWRRDLVGYVSRLIKFRTQADALAVNDIKFIHVDFSAGKRVLVWQRGREGIDDPVIVVANFSDFGTDTRNSGAEYRISNWPTTPPGREWIEITQQRTVAPNFVGREPIYPWEAKVYTLK
jgi:pullulanase